MLEGLASIRWSEVWHAYGPADDVPELLRGLLSVDAAVREEALSELYGTIWHQGTVYEATVCAVPFLVEIVSEPAVVGRPDVLGLLGTITESDDGPGGAHEAVLQRVEAIIGLLRDADPMVRAGAAYVLGGLVELAATLAPLLRAAVDRETDELGRAGILLGLGACCDASAENVAWLHARFGARRDDREGLATAAALAHAAREATPPAVVEYLADACTDPNANSSCFAGLSWDMAPETIPGRALVAARTAALAAVPRMLEALERCDAAVAASFLLEDVMAVVFGQASLDRAPLTLDIHQRAVLDTAVRVGVIWEAPNLFAATFLSHGLPARRHELLAWLAERS